MYGKIHGSFFDSSISDTDPMTRLVFIGMIVLSDQYGRIDMTSQALARRLNLDLDVVTSAIENLMAPDERSRSASEDGCRIVPIDDDRSWGWVVVNKNHYRSEADPDLTRQQTKTRVRRHRAKKSATKNPNTNTDTDTGVTVCNASNADVTEETLRGWFENAWNEYPRKDGKKDAWAHYRATVGAASDRDRLLEHLANYKARLAADKTEFRYTQKGATWFNNWNDEVYAVPPVTKPRGLVT